VVCKPAITVVIQLVHVHTKCVWYGVARSFIRLGALNYYYITVTKRQYYM
jgi:hypothetical protein